MNKYFIYARKSTDEEDRQVLSIEAQLVELREFAKKENLFVVQEFTESMTAKEPGRPIFNQMLKLIEKGIADGILAWHPDRLARNSIDGGKIIYLVDKGKIKDLRFPIFRFENNAYGKFILSIAFGQSKYYVDNLSENIKRGIRHKLRLGGWSGLAPIGYLNDTKTRTVIVDPQRAPLIRKLFEYYATGNYSILEITKLANKWELTTRKGNKIHASLIDKILKRHFYYGAIVWNGEFYEGTHQPIISKELFDRVQQVLKTRGREIKRGRADFVFRGLIRCGECGCMITAEEHKGHHYYHWTKKRKHCTQPSKGYLREETLADQIKLELLKIWLNDTTAKVMLDRLEKETYKQTDTTLSIKLQDELKTIDNKLNKLLDLCLAGVIDQKEYQMKKEELLKRKYEINSKLDKLGRKATGWLEPMRDFIITCNSVGKAIKENDLFKLREICQKAGSNFKLFNKKLSFSFCSPFDLVVFHKKENKIPSSFPSRIPQSPKATAGLSASFFNSFLSNNKLLPNWWRRGDLNP